jgi:hypothetical protein
MIKKTLISTVVILVFYNIFVYINPWKSKTVSQWEDNERTAEYFLFSQNKISSVIVGSSMSTRLIDSLLPAKWNNLSFGGQGVYEGLEIIRKSGKYPDTLLIEMNIILKKPFDNFAGKFFFPGIYQLKKKLPGMRKEYYPASFVQYFMYGITRKYYILRNKFKKIKKKQENKIELKKDTTISDLKKQNYKKLINSYNSDTNKVMISFLEKEIKLMQRKNVTVIFFEMPVLKDLYYSKKQIEIRKIIKEKFPDIKFISLKNYNDYETSDGVHLTPESADKYTKFLLNNINK